MRDQKILGMPVGPAVLVAVVLLAAFAVGLCFVPLFDVLAYEFAAALAFLASMVVGPAAISVVRRTRERPLPVQALFALAAAALALVIPLLAGLLNALRVQNCNLGTGFAFFALLPLCTAVVTGLWGVAIAWLVERPFLAGLLYALLWLLVAGQNIHEAYTGIQVDSYNQLFGWVSGPVYDEVVEPGAALLFARLEGFSWALAGLALAAFFRTHRTPGPRLLWAACLALGLLAGGLLRANAGALGYGRSEADIERVLSATIETERFRIHHQPGLNAAQVSLLARDHEFRLSQIERVLGPYRAPVVDSYVFQSPALKRRLVGAGRTQYAQPWKASMSLNGVEFPHSSLKHELVHVYAGTFGAWPFGASARLGVLINPGLTEGLAVAVEWSGDRFDRHTWSAALQRIGRAPDIAKLFGPIGFWTAAGGQTYTLSGSFVRYLLDTYGPEPLVQAYRDGDLQGHYPKTTPELIGDWRAFLDGLPLDPGTLEVAALRFSQKSVFEKTCAHEVAALYEQAQAALGRGELGRAARALEAVLDHLPDDTRARESLIEVRRREGRMDEAIAIALQLLEGDALGPAAKAGLCARLGDLLVQADRLDEAAEPYRTLLQAHLSDADDRLALIKLMALGRGDEGRSILRFTTEGSFELGLLDLHELFQAHPDWPEVAYLLGRALYNKGQFDRAIPYLVRAGAGLPHPALRAELQSLLGQCHFRRALGDKPTGAAALDPAALADATAVFAVMSLFPRSAGEQLWLDDWLDRLAFEREKGVTYISTGNEK